MKVKSELMNHFEEYKDFIPDYQEFEDRLGNHIPAHLRVNTLKTQVDPLVKGLIEKGVEMEKSVPGKDIFFYSPHLKSPGNSLEYYIGYIHPQALTSCLAPLILSPKPGSFVLDMCASPGGKTAQIAQIMGNNGIVIANELYTNRHISLGNTLSRLGVLISVMTAYQAQEFPLREPFDYILADVPCSGEGGFRAVGNIEEYRKSRKREALPDLQKRIILRGFDLLKDKGEMVYSTCTYNPEENEAVVDFLLKNREDAEILPIEIGVPFEPGITEWKKGKYDEQIRDTARFYPHRIDSVGFFMARIGRGK